MAFSHLLGGLSENRVRIRRNRCPVCDTFGTDWGGGGAFFLAEQIDNVYNVLSSEHTELLHREILLGD